MTAAPGVRRGAILGFGNVAAHGHLPGWLGREDFEIVAVVDPDPERRQLACQQQPELRAYGDVRELLREEHLDFIDVAAPPAFHATAIQAAAAAGVHVLCEKPLTTDLDEYRRLHAMVEEAGVVLHTVHNWKHAEAFRQLRAQLHSGQIGSPRSIAFTTERNGCSVATGANWRVDAAVAGGGILVDHGWHAFYLMVALANERPLRIAAQLDRRRFTGSAVEDTVACHIEFPSLAGEIHLTWAAPQRHTSWRVVGAEGELVIDEDRMICRTGGGERVQVLPESLSAGSHHPDWFAGVIDEFRLALDDPAARAANRNEAELCVLLLTQAYRSGAQAGRPLPIPASLAEWEGIAAA